MVREMAHELRADLVLSNARVLTCSSFEEDRHPRGTLMSGGLPCLPGEPRSTARYVAIKDDRIIGVGDAEEISRFKGQGTREIDCQDMSLVPGFIDAHCHLFALASSLRGVNCGRDTAGSISEIVEAINQRAQNSPPGTWIRAFGYDEFYLAEKRHPNRWDLDTAAPYHPVRLDHRTGHATALNSRALELLNISKDTPDPAGGIIERDDASGGPTGVLFEMGDYIRKHTEHRQDDPSFLEGIRKVNTLLLSRGITSVQDASPGNDYQRWESFRRVKQQGQLTPRVTMMAGASRLESFLEMGLKPGNGDKSLRVGPVKLILSLTTGSFHPHREELNRTVLDAHERGFQVAIHAVEQEAVEAAADAILDVQTALPRPDARHRIEHCSECTPRAMGKIKRGGVVVVTQPSFIYHNGDKFLSLTDERVLPYLYPVASLGEVGISVAAGSDAPISSPDPILGVYSAVARKTRGGSLLLPSEAVSVRKSLKMHSITAAYAAFEEKIKGSISVGKLADLVLLNEDPMATETEGIKRIEVVMTMVGGEVVWQR